MADLVATVAEAILEVRDGDSVAVGGFGLSGCPTSLVDGLCDADLRDLEIISNNIGLDPGSAPYRLVEEGRIRKFVGSFPGGQIFFERFYGGDIELELVPQGTFAERLRAGGVGIPAFYTPVGAGTVLGDGGLEVKYDASGHPIAWSEPKETRTILGRDVVLEHAITPSFGLVKAHIADRAGNLVFNYAGANFNPLIALASRRVIVEATHVVEIGEIDPTRVDVPGIAVDCIVPSPATDPGSAVA